MVQVLGFKGFGFKGLGFKGPGFRIRVLDFRLKGLKGFRVYGLGLQGGWVQRVGRRVKLVPQVGLGLECCLPARNSW